MAAVMRLCLGWRGWGFRFASDAAALDSGLEVAAQEGDIGQAGAGVAMLDTLVGALVQLGAVTGETTGDNYAALRVLVDGLAAQVGDAATLGSRSGEGRVGQSAGPHLDAFDTNQDGAVDTIVPSASNRAAGVGVGGSSRVSGSSRGRKKLQFQDPPWDSKAAGVVTKAGSARSALDILGSAEPAADAGYAAWTVLLLHSCFAFATAVTRMVCTTAVSRVVSMYME